MTFFYFAGTVLGTVWPSKVKLKKDNGDGSFDIVWLEDEAEDTANLEDLKRLGAKDGHIGWGWPNIGWFTLW